MAERSAAEYRRLLLASIYRVERLATGGLLELNKNQCKHLSLGLQITANFLQHEDVMPHILGGSSSWRWAIALLQLYAVVKKAENLVQQCCKSRNSTSWPERALTLFAMKDDVLDILLDVQWWTSVLNILIVPSTELSQAECFRLANQELEQMRDIMALLDVMALSCNDSHKAPALHEKELLLKRILKLHGSSYTDVPGTEDHLLYILSWEHRNQGTATKENRTETDKFKDNLQSSIKLQNAAREDGEHLLKKVNMGMHNGESLQHRDYLLIIQVHALLTDNEENSKSPELNKWEAGRDCPLEGGGQGVVLSQVTWCDYPCALKQWEVSHPCDIRDIKSLKRFHHPHIVRYFRHWEDEKDGKSYMLMERMDRDLECYMRDILNLKPAGQSGPFSLPVAIDIMLQVMKAIWHMHSKGIVHRDLKPKNVLVRLRSESGIPELSALGYVEVKLGDFGSSKENMLTSNVGAISANVGTPYFRAPEVPSEDLTKLGTRNFPRKIDLWSFGIMCSQLLSGQMPFKMEKENLSKKEMQAYIENGGRPSIPDDCPDYLRFCIESCWNYKPDMRPRSSDMWRMLRIAQLCSLGLIDQEYDLFTFTDHSNKVFKLDPSARPQVLQSLTAERPLVTQPSRPKSILRRFAKIVIGGFTPG